MNKNQQGAVVLLVTSVLLVSALMLTFGSYRSVFYQIKRAQNEVEARKQHWKAEGGLECAITEIKYDRSIHPVNQAYSLCDLSSISISPQTVGETIYTLTSMSGYSSLKKNIDISSRSTGAIQARSDLKLIGANEFVPDVEGDDQCVSVRYASGFIMNGSFKTLNPAGVICDSAYQTDTEASDYMCISGDSNCVKHSKSDYDLTVVGSDITHRGADKLVENDFVYDPSLDPFESFFGDTRSNIDSIKAEYEIVQGTVTSGSSGSDSCQDRIKNAYSINDNVWVEGDCDLESGNLLNTTSIGASSKVLVVEDGILSVNGANDFPGIIYQLFTSTIPNGANLSSRWTSDVSTYNNLSTAELTVAQKKKLTFFSRGAFKPKGGYVFDTPGGLTVFGVSLSLTFDSGSVPNNSLKVKWQKGSWNDL
ncbi:MULTISPECIES: hypothetical protein [Vibrio]|uniref:Uncharacterized protein n=1 Tax=Vibrio kanaloae TaxID=170673 RepID=A0ABV4LF08_9VIBR|nr:MULTISPECIES: hypothetical protein [Vibrio]KAB0463710.1 hypothetical protein F7Q89_09550 [Vibrio kanaloae]NOJ00835.1 hypothetical protein [Vibrio kanaloae]OEF13850.1 hypothetical protein A132_07905 [Vibrio kanaloae 5S-149]QPK03571.1 hypothetical protein BTD91_09810 [Vibrio kanaloae]